MGQPENWNPIRGKTWTIFGHGMGTVTPVTLISGLGERHLHSMAFMNMTQIWCHSIINSKTNSVGRQSGHISQPFHRHFTRCYRKLTARGCNVTLVTGENRKPCGTPCLVRGKDKRRERDKSVQLSRGRCIAILYSPLPPYASNPSTHLPLYIIFSNMLLHNNILKGIY